MTSPLEGPAIVVMGVSASGKSSVAALLAARLHLDWIDADDLHPQSNIERMRSGQPLTDQHRWPWLDEVGRRLAESVASGGLIVACSALRRSYRDRIRSAAPSCVFLHLTGADSVLAERANGRVGHFMPASLLTSQLAILEPLAPYEAGVTVDIDATIADIVDVSTAWMTSYDR